MANDNPLQSKLYTELADDSLFEKATSYGISFLNEIMDRDVYPKEDAIHNLVQFDEPIPTEGLPAHEVLDMLHQYGSPATVSSLGARYFGFVAGSSIPAGIAAKGLSTFWDQNSAMYIMSPICSKLEQVVETWLKDIFDLPPSTVAGFVSGTSSANLCALAAARYRLYQRKGWDISTDGLIGAPRIRIVSGNQAHSTVIKALTLLGFGRQNIEWLPADDQGRIRANVLPSLDPNTLVILQAGNVNSGAYDEIETICNLAYEAGAWVHIDGAFGLWAHAVPELRALTRGIGKAQSWAVDGHKTLNTPYDNGIVLCSDGDALRSSLHMAGEYIIETPTHRDGMYHTPEMSRRARIIDLWATIRSLGTEGIANMVLNMHRRAVQFAEEITRVGGFEVANDVVFNQVLISCQDPSITAAVIQDIQNQGVCWVGGSNWRGLPVIRVSICSWATTSLDITRSVTSFDRAMKRITNNKK